MIKVESDKKTREYRGYSIYRSDYGFQAYLNGKLVISNRTTEREVEEEIDNLLDNNDEQTTREVVYVIMMDNKFLYRDPKTSRYGWRLKGDTSLDKYIKVYKNKDTAIRTLKKKDCNPSVPYRLYSLDVIDNKYNWRSLKLVKGGSYNG